MTAIPPSPFDLDRTAAAALVERLGESRYRVNQMLAWVHGAGAIDPAGMTDLPARLREALAAEWAGSRVPEAAGVETSADGTTKISIRLADGAVTETVLIPDDEEPADTGERAGESRKYTQCLSTQVGCAYRCAFCRSGADGLSRNMTLGEILAQRWHGVWLLGGKELIRRTVLMGIGEPLHNAAAVLAALRVMTDQRAGAVSPRRITVSTVGLPAGIRALGETFGGKIALAWSMHAADDATRARLLLVAARHPLRDVVAALRAYPMPPRDRITVEYVMARGVNDSDRHARDVARVLSALRCKLNLIPLNPHDGTDLLPPPPDRVEAFREVVAAVGVSVFVRKPRGGDVLAACGQLLGRAAPALVLAGR